MLSGTRRSNRHCLELEKAAPWAAFFLSAHLSLHRRSFLLRHILILWDFFRSRFWLDIRLWRRNIRRWPLRFASHTNLRSTFSSHVVLAAMAVVPRHQLPFEL